MSIAVWLCHRMTVDFLGRIRGGNALFSPKRYASVNAVSSRFVRKTFLDFFIHQHGHLFVPSSSVLPQSDSDLLFINAGMNQFKSIFLGMPSGPFANFRRVANSQKCIRVGGKHNDFDDVGKDGYHHTFFEMLGNWSFGDYFKKEACEMAWELLTGPFGLPPEQLYVTYFGGDTHLNLDPDEECKNIWLQIGVPANHILPFGMKDNFWDMGDTGPCGPCTEIHYSLRPFSTAAQLVNAGQSEVIELWNLVFIQYNRQSDGQLQKLAKKHIDTGMGLERLTAVLNGSTSNYNTDLFQPLFDVIHKETNCRLYGNTFGNYDLDGIDSAYRIIADHARMCSVSISDGLLPDEVGAGHCLRKVIRRSVTTCRKYFRSSSGLLIKLVPHVAESLKSVFPEISDNVIKVVDVIQDEEDRFLRLLEKGSKLFEVMSNKPSNATIFSANDMWELYFVHGIPEDVILDLVASKGLTADVECFKDMQTKEQSKHVKKFTNFPNTERTCVFTELAAQRLKYDKVTVTDDSHKYNFCFSSDGLNVPSLTSKIVAIWNGEELIDKVSLGECVALITDCTNFYAEEGGQMADVGIMKSENGAYFEVHGVNKVSGYVAHYGTLAIGNLRVSDNVVMSVNVQHREGCSRNHTATHLLNAALHSVLGSTTQKSSHVMQDGLRFDFTAKSALSKEQISQVELFVNNTIENHLSVQRLTKRYDAISMLKNLVTLPGEVYPDVVSLIAIQPEGEMDISPSAISLEPCCGTHLNNTRAIQDFVIFSQKPQAQTIRSIHALTGPQAMNSRHMAQSIESEISSVSQKITQMEEFLDQKIALDITALEKELSCKRALVAEGKLPLLVRPSLDHKIEDLQSRLRKILRLSVRNEIQELAKPLTLSSSEFFVYLLISKGDSLVMLTEAMKRLPKMPCMIFASYKSSLNGHCSVPKDFITNNFTAEIWVQHVLQHIHGDISSSRKTRNQDCVFKLLNVENAAHILDIARKFAEGNCQK